MRAHGHGPCVVLQTSPGHLQAWIRLSTTPLQPAVASTAGKLLAAAYGGDPASTDWRHLGRLAGFTNQKWRTAAGHAPWVKVVRAQAGVAPQAEALLQSARALASPPPALPSHTTATFHDSVPATIAASVAAELYQACMERWHIRQRFPQPDWSIVDCWVARHLLRQRLGSRPGAGNSPQPALSPPPWRPRRLPAPYRRPRGFSFPSPPCVCGSCACLHPARHTQHLFELHRRPIPQRRVQPLLVINFVDESRD